MYTIIAYLKQNSKTIGYRVSDGKSTKDFSKEDLTFSMKNGMSINNAYIRGNSVVLKVKTGVNVVKVKPVIPIKFIPNTESSFLIDEIFDGNVLPSMLDTIAIKIIKKIDKAEPTRNVIRDGRFNTKFGLCRLDELSSGCKTALWVYFMQKAKSRSCVEMTSAGLNAIDTILRILSNYNYLYVSLGFRNIPLEYKNEFEDCYIFHDVVTNKQGTFLDFFVNHVEED